MSNFPLAYRLSWLPRLLKPSLAGGGDGFAPPAMTRPDPPPRTVRLVFAGDISAVANRRAPVVDPEIRGLLASADLVVGNCESPVVEPARRRPGTLLGTRHAMSGRFLADALDAAGIAPGRLVLSVANNHALDQGVEGFEETLAALRHMGVRVAGLAGEPVAKASAGALTVGFLAFTRWRNAGAGAFAGRIAMADDLLSMPDGGSAGCDLLCALPHWDREFRHFPGEATRMTARRLADARAGLVVGGHAHVVQPVERLGGTLAAYGLGDFLGTALPHVPWPCRIGALLAVDVSLDPPARGTVAGYRLHFFLRRRGGGHERLTPVEALERPVREQVFARLRAVYGAPPGPA